jgi:hypothetical protein
VAAVARTQDWETGKVVERRYVDGVAIRADEGTVALLSQAPVDECLRLAVVAKKSVHVDAFSSDEQPVLAIVRNDEYPDGSVQLVEPSATTFLAETVPALQDGGDRLVAKGQTDSGSLGSGQEAPSLEYDVDLPFVSMDAYDPVAADSGAEAAWLRELAAVPDDQREAVVDGSFLTNDDDWNSTTSRYGWAEILGSWEDVSVIAAASGPDCATLVLRAVVTMTYGDSFDFGSYEIAGPGSEPATLGTASIINAYLDADTISALIKQGEAGEARIAINFQLPLSGVAVGP